MNYLIWNNSLFSHFFKPENAGKEILLYVTRNDIIIIGRKFDPSHTDEHIWSNFIRAIKSGPPPSNNKKTLIEKSLYSLEKWKQNPTSIDNITTEYPLYFAYLLFFILPITGDTSQSLHDRNYYERLNQFLAANSFLEKITTLKEIEPLWSDLEKWAINQKNGDYGYFRLPDFSSNWKYVGKPFFQCLLTPKAINGLPELYYEAGLIPDSAYSKEEFRKILLKYGQAVLSLKTNAIDLIRKSDSNELGQSIIETAVREYKKWTGETHEEGVTLRTNRNYTVAPLFLQFKINNNDGEIKFSFRTYSSNDYPEDLKFGEYENLYETNGWSKTLNLKFKESFELKDNFNKWVARFPDRDVRLFVSAGTYQLSTGYWIETESLSKTDPMYLLCRNSKQESIIEWGKSFHDGNFKQEDFDGLPERYSLFKILNPAVSHQDIPLLTLYTEKIIELTGGLKVNFRTFISDYLPEVEITNSDGNEKVFLQYRNTEEKIFLTRKQSKRDRWLLPPETLLDIDFYIKVDGENFEGNQIAYNLAASNDTASKVDGVHLPKRDSFGRHITTAATQYCLGSNIISPMRGSQRYFSAWENLFVSVNEEFASQVTKVTSNNHCGNMLSSFLALKNVLTTEEFYRAFEFYYSKQFSERQTSGNFNLTRTKKASLNFYDYTGILDYDYETKKIVVNPPQFIVIPSNQGKKIMLIGARDSALVEAITNTAPKHNLQVEITKQFSSNEKLLLPDVLTIKAFGKRAEGSGEKNLIDFANELKISITLNYYVQIALKLFSAEITEYEKELLLKNETAQEDYGWARRIFNPENLSYERNEAATFDKCFSLIEYKLNEYAYYNKLWKDGKCYQVDKNWGRYLALKRFKKNVILFDKERKRVAIPWETPLPRLLSESIMLLSGLAPDFRDIDGRNYRVYENIPGIFTENLFHKLGQQPLNKELK